jgi:hypothetical protein
MTGIVATAQLRGRNQLTLPDSIVRAGGFEEGATFVVEFDPGDPDVVRLRRIRSTYSGALKGMFEPTDDYLEDERSTWEDR